MPPPSYRAPRFSTPHRIAAVALFRALLSQSRCLPSTTAQQRNELQNIVRNRFKQARYEQSAQRLRLNFEAGYEAIDHLDAAVAGDEEARKYILDLLQRAPEKVKQSPGITLPHVLIEKVRKEINKPPRLWQNAEAPPTSILERPLPLEKLSGKRHVPKLFNAQGIPVLRIRKPQPESLSGYINRRLQRRQGWHDTRHRLDDELELAKAEDKWDDLMSAYVSQGSKQFGQSLVDAMKSTKSGMGEQSWGQEIVMARREVQEKLEEERERNREWSERMQGVVDREQELYNREKAAMHEAKMQAREKRARMDGTVSVADEVERSAGDSTLH